MIFIPKKKRNTSSICSYVVLCFTLHNIFPQPHNQCVAMSIAALAHNSIKKFEEWTDQDLDFVKDTIFIELHPDLRIFNEKFTRQPKGNFKSV